MKRDKLVYENVVEAIGQSPMIKLNKYPQARGVKCHLAVKADFLNPGGSSKDRIGQFMIEAAERDGLIKPGDTLVENTSGNTGIGLALNAAVKGYKLLVTIPDKMSSEKINTLKALGAEVIITPTSVPQDHPESYISVARRLSAQPGHFHINQYSNEANSDAHYKTTGDEIWDQMDQKLDYVFISVGTGGTISGTAKRLKELHPGIKIVGVDPHGSTLAKPDSLNTPPRSYKIEGIGQEKAPKILRFDLIDDWVKIDDKESFLACRDIIREEALLVGGSCGSVISGAMKYLKEKGLDSNPEIRCVIFLPDSIRNYMTKYLVDEWMVGNGFYPTPEASSQKGLLADKTILDFPEVFPKLAYFDKRLTISDCFDLFRKGLPCIPVRQSGEVIGVVTMAKLISAVSKQGLSKAASCANCLSKEFLTLEATTPLSYVQSCLEGNYNVVLVGSNTSDIFTASMADIAQLLDAETKELI